MENKKRLIDANVLKKALEFADADVCESDEYGARWGFSKHSIVNLINKLPTVDAVEVVADYLIANGVTFATDNNDGCKWIPVTERLPENDGIYLTFNKTKQYEFHFFQRGKSMWPAIWEDDAVTHWMPLPRPPKEDER